MIHNLQNLRVATSIQNVVLNFGGSYVNLIGGLLIGVSDKDSVYSVQVRGSLENP